MAATDSENQVEVNGGVSHQLASLGRQSSIYSLTLDEFQHALPGKGFGSMNMDDFLNSIWTAEEDGQSPQNDAVSNAPRLPRHGSLTLPPPLRRKTVDDVWSEIRRSHGPSQPNPSSSGPAPGHQRQQTFGEITLEDFLIKAGVVREQGHTIGPGSGPVVATEPTTVESSTYVAAGNGYVPPAGVCGSGPGMRLQAGRMGPGGVAVERRQKRMIKNRESASRSRARKQAYTVELEAELNQLREENAQLKQALVEMERRRSQQYLEEEERRRALKAHQRLGLTLRSTSCPL